MHTEIKTAVSIVMTQSLNKLFGKLLPEDAYYCCYDDQDKSNRQWNNAYVERLPESFHAASRGCGGHFLL